MMLGLHAPLETVRMKSVLLALLLCHVTCSFAAPVVLSERDQATLQDQILQQRFSQLLQPLMQRENIDLWLLISRE